MKKWILFAGLCLTIPLYPLSQNSLKCNESLFDDSLLAKLEGQWAITGKIGGLNISNHFTASWILNHQFIELNFTDVQSPPSYMAKVSIGYDCISERYVVHWLDILGGRFSETLGYGTKTENKIEFRFEYPDGPFINQFIYSEKNNSWQLHMTTKNKNLGIINCTNTCTRVIENILMP